MTKRPEVVRVNRGMIPAEQIVRLATYIADEMEWVGDDPAEIKWYRDLAKSQQMVVERGAGGCSYIPKLEQKMREIGYGC